MKIHKLSHISTGKDLASIEASTRLSTAFTAELGEQYLDFVVASMSKPLNRYSLRVGKIYGSPTDRYKVLKISGDTIFVKDVNTGKVRDVEVNKLLKQWSNQGVKEIAFIDDLVDTIKRFLEPILGPVLSAGLIAWLYTKLR